MPRNTAASKIGNGVISLLWQLRCHCDRDYNQFSSLSNTTVVSIFPNPCLWRRSLRSNLEGIDLEELYRATLKQHGTAKKTWHMTQSIFSSNFYWKIGFKFCILEQIITTVLFTCISSINNKRSLLRFQSTTAPSNRGWSTCAGPSSLAFLAGQIVISRSRRMDCSLN